MNDTPETDAIAEMAHNLVLDWDCRDRGDTTEKPVVVPAEFARRLERERDEARKEVEFLKKTPLRQRCQELERLSDHWCDMHSIASKGRDQLRDAVKWALGESGGFGPRPKGVGAYWWRKDLRKRAGISEPNKTTKNE